MFDDLKTYQASIADRRISTLFDGAHGKTRAQDFSVGFKSMHFDYSKTNLDATAIDALLELADVAGVSARRDAMFSGALINETEGRAVLHTALRDPGGAPVFVDGENVKPAIAETLARMQDFAENLRIGQIVGAKGAPFTDVINIGIGGSDLGPAMGALALSPFMDGPRLHFVSNVDGAHIADTLAGLDPTTTLVIVASKTFTTIETMTNANTARTWLAAGVEEAHVGQHLVAVSTAQDKTAAFGIAPDRVFGFEDWVGGRYSMWGPIGLPLMLGMGARNFRAFLQGGAEMDHHFRQAVGRENMPLMLALVGIWHHQICGYPTRAVLPYDQRLSRLPAYLQQLEMESNGKSVAMDGSDLGDVSGPIVWGEPGTNGQHAFYQLIHQGTGVVPCEFMVAARGAEPELDHQHKLLISNCLAQSQALMLGRPLDVARQLMQAKGLSGAEMERQARHRVFAGNRPSTTLVYPQMSPEILGAIIALYEHRVFVEGVILGINSFDQWGVELGKELATELQPVVEGQKSAAQLDGSTRALVQKLRAMH